MQELIFPVQELIFPVQELIFPVQELIFSVQEFRSESHMPLRAAEKSHMPLHAKHKRSNMAARTGCTSVIRERNERGFGHFLQNLKSVFRLFLTPNNVQLTAYALNTERSHITEAEVYSLPITNPCSMSQSKPLLTGVYLM